MKHILKKIHTEPLLLTVTLLIIAAVSIIIMTEITKTPNLHDGMKVVVRSDRAKVTATIAASAASRSKGLAGAKPLDDHQAMLFAKSEANPPVMVMRGVGFPIDIIWISKGTVSEVTANVQPQPGVPDDRLTRYQPTGPADQVLEVPAGWAAKHGVQPGDPIKISSI